MLTGSHSTANATRTSAVAAFEKSTLKRRGREPGTSEPPDSRLRWRQEHDLMLRGERHDIRRVLLPHAVNCPEQIIEFSRRRDPEQTLNRLLGFVEQAGG